MATDLRVWGRKPQLHFTPETRNTRCDMCPELDCIEQKGARVHKWMYYCAKLNRRMTFKELYEITKDECPLKRSLKRRHDGEWRM